MNNPEDILRAVCLDHDVPDGIFNMENNNHMDVLQRHLIKRGISESNSVIYRNRMIEGRFPERQAYNANGILVTFPTPEYKQKAIARGTHFEGNPKKGEVNLFQASDKKPTEPATPEPSTAPTQQKLEPSQALQPASSEPNQDEKPLDATKDDIDDRTPEEKKQDATSIEKILSSASPPSIDFTQKYPNTEAISYTLQEANHNNFYEKDKVWYTSDGAYVGKKWYCEFTKKLLIIP